MGIRTEDMFGRSKKPADQKLVEDRAKWDQIWDEYVADRHDMGDHDNCPITADCHGDSDWYRRDDGVPW